MAGPLTASTMADPIVTVKSSPAPFFHLPEPWQHLPLPLQLTSKNLSDLGAVLATLSIQNDPSGSTPQSLSDSSSDSDSCHRLHRSSKKVCLREDLNTIREISPRRLKKPSAIEVPDLAASKAKWRKPDTPAPWHAFQSTDDNDGPFVDVSLNSPSDSGSPLRTPTQSRFLKLPPLSPMRPTKISIKRKRNNTAPLAPLKPDNRHTALQATRRPRIQPVSRRKGSTGTIAIRRVTQRATPRPRSLPTSPRTLPTCSSKSTPAELINNQNSNSARPAQPGPSILVRSFAYDEIRNKVDSPALLTPSSWPPVEDSSLLRLQPAEQARAPRTYVDHVRNARGAPVTSKIVPNEAQVDMRDTTAQRRRSSF
jgi:hypothetical protein